MGDGTAMWRLKLDWSPADGNGDKGEIGLLRTGELLRWRRDAAEGGMLWGAGMLWGF